VCFGNFCCNVLFRKLRFGVQTVCIFALCLFELDATISQQEKGGSLDLAFRSVGFQLENIEIKLLQRQKGDLNWRPGLKSDLIPFSSDHHEPVKISVRVFGKWNKSKLKKSQNKNQQVQFDIDADLYCLGKFENYLWWKKQTKKKGGKTNFDDYWSVVKKKNLIQTFPINITLKLPVEMNEKGKQFVVAAGEISTVADRQQGAIFALVVKDNDPKLKNVGIRWLRTGRVPAYVRRAKLLSQTVKSFYRIGFLSEGAAGYLLEKVDQLRGFERYQLRKRAARRAQKICP